MERKLNKTFKDIAPKKNRVADAITEAFGKPDPTIADLAMNLRAKLDEANEILHMLHSRDVAIDAWGGKNYTHEELTGAKVVDETWPVEVSVKLYQEEPVYDVKRKEF